ncbi:MAG TPA: mannose-1-phosphate guanyltransferase [Candidatus Bathyarchaeia archaeon]|nr:mannose-1-phosphate guanyltransferase [Candidatus Bathyarchaeia archaeon]
MQAVVMAGGEGTRLRPLTTNRAKPMVPVVNKPMLEHTLDLLKQHAFKDVVLTLHYLPEAVHDYFQDGDDFGVKLTYLIEEKPLGTAGGVKNAERYLDGTFVVFSGDVLTDINLSKALSFHKQSGAIATIVLTRVSNPTDYGIVITEKNGRIKRFLEKPGWGEVFSDTINSGIYILEPEILKHVRTDMEFDFSKNLFPALLELGEPLYGYASDGYWCDIGNPVQYLQANHDALQGRLKVSIPGKETHGVWIDEGAEIEDYVEIKEPALIGRKTRIRDKASIGPFSIIGSGVTVDEKATIKRSVVWNNTVIGPRADLAGCLVGEKCTIKDAAIVLEGAVVGDECIVGRGATVKSGIRIWPGKMIEAGAMVTMDLKWGMRWMTSLFGNHGITGLANIEITPEFAAKLGVAFGSFLGRGTSVVVGRDTHRVSRMVKRAIMAGLTAAGVDVSNLQICPAPVTRYMIRSLGATAGIMVSMLEIDPRMVSIRFFDSNGMELDRASEKKVESVFFREAFQRVLPDEVGDLIYPARTVDFYRKDAMKFLDSGAIRKAGLKVVIDCANGAGSAVAPAILGEIGCDVTTLNSRFDEIVGPRTFEQVPSSILNLARVVKAIGADLGMALDSDADRVLFVDEEGSALSGDVSLALLSRERIRERKGGKVVVPVSSSRIINHIVEPEGGTVIRCKIGARSLLDAMIKHEAVFGGEETGGFVFPEFQRGFDGIFSSAKITEILARKNTRLTELCSDLPSLYMARGSIASPMELRGHIMRSLIEEFRDRQIDTIDGIKVFYDDTWILMHPSSEEPVINLYAEAPSKEAADKAIHEYVEKIKALIKA